MNELLSKIMGLELKWRIAGLLLVVIAINPILYPLSSGSIESTSPIALKSVETDFSRNFNEVVEMIRENSMWIEKIVVVAVVAPVVTDEDLAKLNAESKAQDIWVLVGLIHSENERHAVVRRGQEYIHAIKEGDILPTGERIVSIRQDSIVLSKPDNNSENGPTNNKELVLYPTSF